MLRQIGLRSRFLIGFGAIWVLLSSYVQWWFSSPAMLPEMIATWAVCLGCAAVFFKDQNQWRTATAFAGFVFCGTNFVLCLYPPYQIPLVLLMTAILIGVGLEERDIGERRSTRRALLLIAGGLITIAVVLVPFWFDVRATLEIVNHTAYPGARRSSGGDLDLFKLFSGVLGFFESEQASLSVYDNISEASNFFPLWPAALLAIVVARFRNNTPISPLVASLSVGLLFSKLVLRGTPATVAGSRDAVEFCHRTASVARHRHREYFLVLLLSGSVSRADLPKRRSGDLRVRFLVGDPVPRLARGDYEHRL